MGTNRNEIIREADGKKLVGQSHAIEQVIEEIALVAPHDDMVTLQGETGVGKDLVAQLIHVNSPRRAKPFVAVNGAAIPDDLWEAECFGATKGSFTGAQHRDGLFRRAQGGTLFLNELQDLSRGHQAKLKDFLQDQLIRRVGDDRPLKLDVRIIVASNVDLDQMVAEKQMARDVRERVGRNMILMPPLRQRPDDIPLLAEYFLESRGQSGETSARKVASSAQQALVEYPWPGNVRELKNVVEAAWLKRSAATIEAADVVRLLPARSGNRPESLEGSTTLSPLDQLKSKGLKKVLQDREKELLQILLNHCGSLREAARQARIDPKTFREKLTKSGLGSTQVPVENGRRS